jgi:transcriptional regulator with XRE-family HTH domain
MDTIKIGKFIAQLRHEAELTQEQLGNEIGVSNKTISRWENGVYLPSVDMMQILCKKFDVSINDLLSGKRLIEVEYKENAEKNINDILENSFFVLEDRVNFFKSKWLKENLFEIILSLMLVLAMFVVGLVWDNGLQISAIFLLIFFILFWNKRQKEYVNRYLS